MGNNTSSTKANTQQVSQTDAPSKSHTGKIMDDTKKVLLLHKSLSDDQLKVVRNFRDALVMTANGGVRVTEVVNIAKQASFTRDLAWLDDVNNVMVICLSSEAVAQLETIVREKRFVDENGHLHGKVFTVSFGSDQLTADWSAKGIKRGLLDARDFSFGFDQVDVLKPKDFEKSEKMTALVAAIKGAS